MRLRRVLPTPLRRPVDAHLGLGSNVGDRLATLEAAIADLDAVEHVEVTDVSGVYETEPVSDIDQDPFLNLVVAVRTTLAPHELLAAANRVEDAHGRDRSREQRWGPRPLDIDVLLYGDATVSEADLEIPHPRLPERAFVLVPLLEVLPDGELPDGRRLATLLAGLAPVEGVELAVRLSDVPGERLERPEGPRGPGPYLADEWERPDGPPPGVYR